MHLYVFTLITAVTAVALVDAQSKYSSKFDNGNLDEVLQSDRLLKSYMDCILERGKCTPEGSELKKYLPEALENNCAKCTEKQRAGTLKVIKFLVEKKRNYWDEAVAKFDPEGKYKEKYEEEIKNLGINV